MTVGAGLIVKSAGIVYGGMQSHCGTLTFSTATHSKRDVTCEIISLLCTIYTMPAPGLSEVKPAIQHSLIPLQCIPPVYGLGTHTKRQNKRLMVGDSGGN